MKYFKLITSLVLFSIFSYWLYSLIPQYNLEQELVKSLDKYKQRYNP